MGRKDIADSYLKVPDLIFDEKLVLSDSKQHAELLFLGHAHTPGDAFLYLPRHKILCTGDACTNGAFNFMGHSDSASWIRVLEKAQQLDVKLVCPGHGPIAHKDVLGKQKRYFAELRAQVKKGIDTGKDFDDILKGLDMPWHKEWTGIEANTRMPETRHVFDELTGRTMPWDLIEDFGIYEGPSPTKKDKGWTVPKKIVVPAVMPAKLAELKRIAPEVFFIPVKSIEEAAKEAVGADAVLGFCSADIAKAKSVRWIQIGHAGVEKDLVPEVVNSDICVTNLQRLHGPNVADQAFCLLLALNARFLVPPRYGHGARSGGKQKPFYVGLPQKASEAARAARQDHAHRRHGRHRHANRAAGRGVWYARDGRGSKREDRQAGFRVQP